MEFAVDSAPAANKSMQIFVSCGTVKKRNESLTTGFSTSVTENIVSSNSLENVGSVGLPSGLSSSSCRYSSMKSRGLAGSLEFLWDSIVSYRSIIIMKCVKPHCYKLPQIFMNLICTLLEAIT